MKRSGKEASKRTLRALATHRMRPAHGRCRTRYPMHFTFAVSTTLLPDDRDRLHTNKDQGIYEMQQCRSIILITLTPGRRDQHYDRFSLSPCLSVSCAQLLVPRKILLRHFRTSQIPQSTSSSHPSSSQIKLQEVPRQRLHNIPGYILEFVHPPLKPFQIIARVETVWRVLEEALQFLVGEAGGRICGAE